MFGEPTKFNIMFGPDRCGYKEQTHVIFTHDGFQCKKKEEIRYKQRDVGISHLYRLVLRPDDTVLVQVDDEDLYNGSIIADWTVPMHHLRKQDEDAAHLRKRVWVDPDLVI